MTVLLPKLMQTNRAAEYLGFSPSKFRTLGLPAKRHGGNVLYDRNDLDQFAEALPYESGDLGTGENTCDAVLK